MSLHSGHKVVRLSKEDEDNVMQKFKGYADGVVKLNPGGWFFTSSFPKRANQYYDFKLHSDDVIVLTYPKCGTTWTLEVVWNMRNNPNLDNPDDEINYNFRTPFLEFDFIMDTSYVSESKYGSEGFLNEARVRCPGKHINVDNVFFTVADELARPRTIKTHLPFSLMPKQMLGTCKVVYVIRHPKDVCSSFYHHHQLFKVHQYGGTFDEFIDFFINDKIMFSPYWEHIKEAWNLRHHPNLFITFFEKMKQDPIKEFKRLDKFLGTNLSTNQLKKISEYTSFYNMQVKASSGDAGSQESDNSDGFTNLDYAKEKGGFFRKGVAGEWKNKLTNEQNEKFDKWIDLHLKDMDDEFRAIFKSL